MTSTGTRTTTYTVADIRKVVENFAADYSMIAQSTGLRTREQVVAAVSDLNTLARYDYLVSVTIYLLDKAGSKVQVAAYEVSESAVGWKTDAPGNALWPRIEGSSLRIIATLTDPWWNMAESEKEAFIKTHSLNSPWKKTDLDTSLTGLVSSAGQKYASNGYGWERTNYVKGQL